jgi:hypothetical protein
MPTELDLSGCTVQEAEERVRRQVEQMTLDATATFPPDMWDAVLARNVVVVETAMRQIRRVLRRLTHQ